MALKVVSSYTPTTLKVVNNYGMQGVTYNPQQTAPSTVLQNPATAQQVQPAAPASFYQPTVSTRRLQPTAQSISDEQARLFRIEYDRRIAEQAAIKKRLIDAKNNEIATLQGGFANKLKDKATLGDLRRQRGGRELAAKYWQENEKEWGQQLLSRQRNYEVRGASLKDWVMQAETEAEYNKRVNDANIWLDSEYKAITDDIKDYQVTQLELANYAELPLNGKLAGAARFTKDMVAGVTSRSWNALTWTASQPQRAVNTVKNFVNPGNLRQYYGGEEKRDPKDITGKGSNPFAVSANQLRKSYNASKDQRIVGFSKADEEARLKGWSKEYLVNGKKRVITRDPASGFNAARIKYGDDVVDMMLDPMNFFAGAGSASKVGQTSKTDKLLAFAGKSKKLRNLIISGETGKEWLKTTKAGLLAKKLGEEFVPRGEKANQAVVKLFEDLRGATDEFKMAKQGIYDRSKADLRIGNKVKSDFLLRQAAHTKRLTADVEGFRSQAEKLSQDFVKRLDTFSNREVQAMTRYARNGDWSAIDKLKVNKYRRADLERFVDDYQAKARTLAKSEGLKRRASKYLPEFTGRGYDPTAQRTLFGEKYIGQGKQQLQESIIMRDFVSNWDESNDYLKQLSAAEKSILRNVKKTGRGITALEQGQLDIIKARKENLLRLQSRFDKKIGSIKGAIDYTKQQAQPALSIKRHGMRFSARTNLTKQGFKNSAADMFHLPMKIWKKSVLKYNPAWYVNNTAWNVPASVSAAGADVFSEYGKLLTSRKYWEKVRKEVPEGVMSKISQEIGKGGLASKIEDTSRLATFLALKKKGFSDDAAIKQVNRWLFDYGTKNWERPIKGILPFWQWQKNIVRLGTTMPFHSPKSAKVYSEGYKKFYERPYNELPHEVQEYNDPETGKTVKYDPRKFYKGKAKIGDNWYGLPFFAVNPETAAQFGTNPYLLSAADYLTSSDRLGNSNTNRSGASILGERFPQANLARHYKARNDEESSLWFSQSGNSKSKQGFDEKKRNYDKSLDKRVPYANAKKSFLGIPRGVKFDRQEYETKKRLTSFNEEFFATDWDAKEDADYKAAQAEKEALARKFGFDLKKDIYDNYWSKYDTETTSNTKRLKEEAAKFNSPDSGWWKDYFALPAGSKTSASQRRPFLINKFDEWKRNHTFAKNAYYKLPKKGEINPHVLKREENESQIRRAEGQRKYQRKLAYEYGKATGDWSRLYALGGGSESKRQYDLAKKTGDWSYFDKNPGVRRSSPFQFDGKFFKSAETMEKYKRGSLWVEYYALKTSQQKQDFLDKHPHLRKYKQPTTQAEWDALRATLRQERKDKLNSLPGFGARQSRLAAGITASVRTSFGKRSPVRFKI